MSTLFDKSVSILNYLGQAAKPVGVMQLARELGLPKSSASRLLSMLSRYDLAVKDRDGLYQTGPGTLLWASAYSAQSAFIETCKPFLETIAHITDHSVILLYYGIGRKLFMVDGIFVADQALGKKPRLGATIDMSCSSGGKAVLMHLPENELDEYFSNTRLIQRAPDSITSEKTLRDQLRLFRQRGYAEEMSEYLPSVSGIAAPLLNQQKYPLGSISIVSSAYQHSRTAWTRTGSFMAETCQKLSIRLQNRGIA